MNVVRSATRNVSHQQLTTESTFGAHSSLVRSATRNVNHQQLTTESTFSAHSSLVRSATRNVNHQQLTTESTFSAHSSLATVGTCVVRLFFLVILELVLERRVSLRDTPGNLSGSFEPSLVKRLPLCTGCICVCFLS